MDNKKIGEYIHLKRKAIGLTQAELGDMLGVTSKAVSKWECGVALPDVSLFSSLSEVLKIDVSELLEGKDNEHSEEKISKKKNILIIILSIIVSILLILSIFLGIYYINNYDRVKVYELVSSHEAFSLKGKLEIVDGNSYISIFDVFFKANNNSKILDGYYISYELYYDDVLLYQRGNVEEANIDDDSIVDFRQLLESISIFTSVDYKIMLNSDECLFLKIKLLDENGRTRTYSIPVLLG